MLHWRYATEPRKKALRSLAGLAAVLAVAGCSAGQNTQTDTVEPAVNGTLGRVGPIVLRDAQIAYPRGNVYPAGGEAPLVLTIVNTGSGSDELVEVTSAVAEDTQVSGDRNLTPRAAIQVGTPDREATATPSSSAVTTTRTPTSSPSAPPSTSPPASSSPASSSSAAPSSTSTSVRPAEIGKATIVLKGLNDPLRPGMTYPVTFVFRNAGSVTLDLPIATPTTARPEPTPHG
jgi:copper(I)-binding protein